MYKSKKIIKLILATLLIWGALWMGNGMIAYGQAADNPNTVYNAMDNQFNLSKSVYSDTLNQKPQNKSGHSDVFNQKVQNKSLPDLGSLTRTYRAYNCENTDGGIYKQATAQSDRNFIANGTKGYVYRCENTTTYHKNPISIIDTEEYSTERKTVYDCKDLSDRSGIEYKKTETSPAIRIINGTAGRNSLYDIYECDSSTQYEVKYLKLDNGKEASNEGPIYRKITCDSNIYNGHNSGTKNYPVLSCLNLREGGVRIQNKVNTGTVDMYESIQHIGYGVLQDWTNVQCDGNYCYQIEWESVEKTDGENGSYTTEVNSCEPQEGAIKVSYPRYIADNNNMVLNNGVTNNGFGKRDYKYTCAKDGKTYFVEWEVKGSEIVPEENPTFSGDPKSMTDVFINVLKKLFNKKGE